MTQETPTTDGAVPASRAWGDKVGYSRAVRRGPLIEVAGTVASGPSGEVLYPNDGYEQTRHILSEMLEAIKQLGGDASNVVRTRIFLNRIDAWEDVGRAHVEVFGQVRPACSMVEVAALLHPELVVEIEATAWVDDAPAGTR